MYPKMTAEQKHNIAEAMAEAKSIAENNINDLKPNLYNVREIRKTIIGHFDKMKDALDSDNLDTFVEEMDSLNYYYSDVFEDDLEFFDQFDVIETNLPEWVDDDE